MKHLLNIWIIKMNYEGTSIELIIIELVNLSV